jgi:hypothetical protein
LKSAGLVTERKQANRVIYSVVASRLAGSVGVFLSAVCPDKAERARGKKKTKSDDKKSVHKAATKQKHKAQPQEPRPRRPEPGERAGKDNGGSGDPIGTVDARSEVSEASGVGAIWPVRDAQRHGARDGHSTPRT